MKLGYSYQRFSRPEQAKGDSIRRQIELRDAWCEKNKVTLDTGITLQDLGVSGFTGLHRSNPDRYALAAFLDLVNSGRIPRDSYLIIENLDRLSREHTRPALMLFLGLLEAGINVVTLEPEYVYGHDSTDQFSIIIALAELSRGHGESVRKSKTVGAAWRQKKAKASTKPVTAMCPFWLKLVDDKFEKIPDRVKVVRDIFDMCINGLGVGAICRTLMVDKVRPFKGRLWQKSSVARILSNRAVMGEYQPHVGSKLRKPVGDAIKGYYPVVITEEVFADAQQAMKGRKKSGGRERTKCTNLFTSLVFDAEDGTKWNVENKGEKNSKQGGLIFTNTEAQLQATAPRKAFPYDIFERAMLVSLREITAADLSSNSQRADAARLTVLTQQIAENTKRTQDIQQQLEDSPDITGLVVVLGNLEKKRKELVAEYETAKRKLSTPVADGAEQVRGLVEMLEQAGENKTQVRTKLRAKIASVVDRFTVNYHTKGKREVRNITVSISFRHVDYKRVVRFDYAPRGTNGVPLGHKQKPRVRSYDNGIGTTSKTSFKPKS
jgi:DNA invertase Pin-like site-specific DNA recombinase